MVSPEAAQVPRASPQARTCRRVDTLKPARIAAGATRAMSSPSVSAEVVSGMSWGV